MDVFEQVTNGIANPSAKFAKYQNFVLWRRVEYVRPATWYYFCDAQSEI